MTDQKSKELIIVRPDAETLNNQSLPGFIGICASTTGAKGIAMYLAIIPPGGIAEPHYHPEHLSICFKNQILACGKCSALRSVALHSLGTIYTLSDFSNILSRDRRLCYGLTRLKVIQPPGSMFFLVICKPITNRIKKN
jgi:hypothetical protein